MQTYFQRHKDQLTLREPYVSVRYLSTEDRAAAQEVREELRTLSASSDSAWNRLVREYAADTAQAREWSRRYLPQSQLGSQIPALQAELRELEVGDTAPIVSADDRYHVRRRISGSIHRSFGVVPSATRRSSRSTWYRSSALTIGAVSPTSSSRSSA